MIDSNVAKTLSFDPHRNGSVALERLGVPTLSLSAEFSSKSTKSDKNSESVPAGHKSQGFPAECFMILIGTMNLTRTRETGQFYCPTCRCAQEYRLRSRRPFLTLYFIPVVPIGAAEWFVDCRGCRDKWDPTVLQMDQREHEQVQTEQFQREALRSAVLVVLADDQISGTEVKVLQQIAQQLLGRMVDREELGELCSIAQQNKIRAANYVMTVSRRWSETQKSEALQAMFLAATAEGKLDGAQLQVMTQMRDILELTEQEYQSAIEAALQRELVE